jgi:uncharacterized membrane protein
MPFRAYLACVAFSVFGLTAQAVTGAQSIWIARIVALITLTLAVTVVVRRMSAVTVLVALVIGAVSEIVGLYTGWPFGRYFYTDQWWPTVFLTDRMRFPLLLPVAWLMMAGASFLLVRRWFPRAGVINTGLLTGVIAAAADFPMEYTMVRAFDYWRWPGHSGPLAAPLTNVFGWFLVSALAGAWFRARHRADDPRDLESIAVLAWHVAFCGFAYALHVITNLAAAR